MRAASSAIALAAFADRCVVRHSAPRRAQKCTRVWYCALARAPSGARVCLPDDAAITLAVVLLVGTDAPVLDVGRMLSWQLVRQRMADFLARQQTQ